MEPAEVVLAFDEAAYRAAITGLRRFGPALEPRLRVGLHTIGEQVAEEARGIVRAYPSRGVGRSRGTRRKLADSITTRQSGQGANQSVLILSTGRLLPTAQQALVKAWNTSEYRHPVFGNRRRWSSQAGVRYFRQDIVERQQPELTRVINRAVEETMREAGLG